MHTKVSRSHETSARFAAARSQCLRFVGIAVLLLTACATVGPEGGTVDNLFDILEQQGYQANIGLAGTYEPGNVIQTQEPKGEGDAQPLATPIVFLWGTDCFPNRKPRVAPFVLPESSRHTGQSFSVGGGLLGLLLPGVSLSSTTVVDYRASFGGAEVHSLAKGDLSRRFSEKCVGALAQAIEDGDRVEWYSVIVEAVVAESLMLEVSWTSGSSASARLAQTGLIENQLSKVVGSYSERHHPSSAGLKIAADSAQKTVLVADGPVIVGFRARPLQPVYAE